jgi:hypothetical protein
VIAGSIVELGNRVAAPGPQRLLSDAWNVELDQLLATDLMLRVAYQERHDKRELVVDPLQDALSLSSGGRSYSRAFEVTVRRRLDPNGEINVSYVRSKVRAKTRRARAGVQFFNLAHHFNPRDVQKQPRKSDVP